MCGGFTFTWVWFEPLTLCRGLAHDEETYPRPFEFIPERFVNEDGILGEDDSSFAFGFGRR